MCVVRKIFMVNQTHPDNLVRKTFMVNQSESHSGMELKTTEKPIQPILKRTTHACSETQFQRIQVTLYCTF